MRGVVPFLRVADADATAAWYARPGFHEEWQTAPHLLLHLHVDDVDAVAARLGACVELTSSGVREIELTKPDGNRLRVGTPVAA